MRENRHIRHRQEERGAQERSREARRFEQRHHAEESRYEAERARSAHTEQNYNERHEHIGFDELVRKVEAEYIRKGYPRAEAHEYAVATAGKVWHRQHMFGVHREHPIY